MLVTTVAAFAQFASIGLAIYAVLVLGMAFWPVAGMLIAFNLILGAAYSVYASYAFN